jgi:putative glutathione S-transferase
VDYPNLWGYLKDLYQRPGVAETVNMDHIQKHYYGSHESINPTRIVPKGPILDFTEAHDRGRFSGRTPQGNGYTRSA